MNLLRVENISKTLGNRLILNNLTVNMNVGDIKVLIGPSGGGKSTLLQCMNLLLLPETGDVYFEDKKIDMKNSHHLCYLRQNVGMIFQDFNLFDHLNVIDNVTLALKKVKNLSKDEADTIARKQLDKVGLANRAGLYPAQLSGGQKQRVAIARALAMEPKMLLLDEPTSALDPELVGEVLNVIRELAEQGMPMIMATHQMDFAKNLATEILFMEQGSIIEQGSPTELLNNPNSRTSDFCTKTLI